MKWLVNRYRMNKLLKRLNDFWNRKQSIDSLQLTDVDLATLRLLEECDCVRCRYPMGSNYPYLINRGSKSLIYFTHRSELWANRVMSFIAGIITSLLTAWLRSKIGF